MFVHFKTEQETVRVYLDGDDNSYANRSEFDAIATIKYCNDDVAYVCAALGTFPLAAFRQILAHCESMGVKEVRWEHKTKSKSVTI